MERKLLLAIAAVVVTVLGPIAVKADPLYNNILASSNGSDAGDFAGPLYDFILDRQLGIHSDRHPAFAVRRFDVSRQLQRVAIQR